MQCYIYKGTKKEGLYIYLPKRDVFTEIPEELLNTLGKLSLALIIKLTPERKLQKEDATTVIENITNQGYHVQAPESLASWLVQYNSRQSKK